MVSANGAPTGSPAMAAAAAEWVPAPSPVVDVAAGVYAYRARWSNFRSAKRIRKRFFLTIKKKISRKKFQSRRTIPYARYNTVAKPQSLPSNILYIVGRLHNIIGAVLKYIILQYIYI